MESEANGSNNRGIGSGGRKQPQISGGVGSGMNLNSDRDNINLYNNNNNTSISNLPLINPKHLSLDQNHLSYPLDQLKSTVMKINNMIPGIVNDAKQLKKKAHFLKRI